MRTDPRTPSDDPNDDRCRVCGSQGGLSFEHLPPRAAGNDTAAWLYDIQDWLARNDLGENRRATIQQRGAGAHTLCRECNVRAGRLYVPELVDWTRRARVGLAHMTTSVATRTPWVAELHCRRDLNAPARVAAAKGLRAGRSAANPRA